MNGTYFKSPIFPENLNITPTEEENRVDNYDVLNKNSGKKAKIFMTFKHSNEWRDREFSGIIENFQNEYIIMSDPKTGNWYLIPIKYICYIEFEEKIIH